MSAPESPVSGASCVARLLTHQDSNRVVALDRRGGIDRFGPVIDVFVSERRDAAAAWRFVDHAVGSTTVTPLRVVTDQAASYPRLLDEQAPEAGGTAPGGTANNRREAVHGPAHAAAAADARDQHRHPGSGSDCWARLSAERGPWPLRTRGRRTGQARLAICLRQAPPDDQR